MFTKKFTDKEIADFKKKEELIAAERKKYTELADQLGIPNRIDFDRQVSVKMKDLWEILSDDVRLTELVSRLKMKAFW